MRVARSIVAVVLLAACASGCAMLEPAAPLKQGIGIEQSYRVALSAVNATIDSGMVRDTPTAVRLGSAVNEANAAVAEHTKASLAAKNAAEALARATAAQTDAAAKATAAIARMAAVAASAKEPK